MKIELVYVPLSDATLEALLEATNLTVKPPKAEESPKIDALGCPWTRFLLYYQLGRSNACESTGMETVVFGQG